MRKSPLVTLALAAGLVLAGPACDDTTGPSFGPVPNEPSEATVFDFERSDIRDPSAFDATGPRTARPDQTPEWDFLFAVRDDGTAELRPRDAVVGDGSAAGFRTTDQAFEGIDRAPEGDYVTGDPVPVGEGTVLIGRTRQDPGFVINCRHFYKLEVLSVDDDANTLTFRHLINPACGGRSRSLVPGSSTQD